MVEARIEGPNGFWEEEDKIRYACDSAEAVIYYLIENGLVGDEMIYDYQKSLSQPFRALTEEGRDLFEYIYSLSKFD